MLITKSLSKSVTRLFLNFQNNIRVIISLNQLKGKSDFQTMSKVLSQHDRGKDNDFLQVIGITVVSLEYWLCSDDWLDHVDY